MVSIPMIVILGGFTFGVYRWGDADIKHLVIASLFGLFLGATPWGPKIMGGANEAMAGIASFLGSLA
ncbi:hypothetical protein [Streptomyces sp. NPDC007063]|uniref:hypothetical protein n=1 Tax=Streptomyces sp. NPDC007063 TaxID=3364772 RepID=UPI0036991091